MAQAQALSRLGLGQVPGVRQALLLVGIAAAVALGIAVVLWSRTPNYALLYSKLPAKDAAAVVQALQTANIDYRLDNNTGGIMVPSSKVGEARLKLAAKGLPESGNVGMDMVAGESGGFGVSDFMEKARYQQMLEKDLADTIASLQSVKSARVHLALPTQSVFVRNRRAGTASVLVDLYPGRDLGQSQVAAIVHLVASSVANLDPDRVTVVDQQGSLLTSRANGELAVTSTQFRLRHRIEKNYANRIEQILTPLVGAGHVHAQVVAAMDFTRKESTTEHYDPAKVLRSEQTSKQVRSGGEVAVGIPGALSNTPTPPPAKKTAAKGAGNGASNAKAESNSKPDSESAKPRDISTSATRNYELNRTISHVETPVGEVRHLSVAVVIDSPGHLDASGNVVSKPLSKDKLAQLTALVKDAVGFDAGRGDTVSVVSAPFQAAAAPAAVTPPSWWQRPTVRNYVKQGLGVLIAIVLILFVLRPLLRSLTQPSAPRPPRLKGPGDAAEVDELGADQVSLSGGAPQSANAPAMNYEQKVGMAKRIAAEDPRRVAQVVKNWVGEDG